MVRSCLAGDIDVTFSAVGMHVWLQCAVIPPAAHAVSDKPPNRSTLTVAGATPAAPRAALRPSQRRRHRVLRVSRPLRMAQYRPLVVRKPAASRPSLAAPGDAGKEPTGSDRHRLPAIHTRQALGQPEVSAGSEDSTPLADCGSDAVSALAATPRSPDPSSAREGPLDAVEQPPPVARIAPRRRRRGIVRVLSWLLAPWRCWNSISVTEEAGSVHDVLVESPSSG